MNPKTKMLVIIGSIIVVIAIIGFSLFSYANTTYSKAVTYQEDMNARFADVQSAYQRRADLIPNLVNTVAAAANNEKEILTKVTQARAGIVGIDNDIKNAKNPQELEMMGRKINTAINLAFEAYPQIRSTQNFSDLQAQLEGSENRVNVARNKYNDAVKEYNVHIRGFVKRIALGWLAEEGEFVKKEGFKAAEGSENAPKVEFNK